MNSSMFPGVQLTAEPVEGNKVGMDVVTVSGTYTTKGVNFEVLLIGGGGNGGSQNYGGSGGANVIKRLIGAPIGTMLTVLIGGVAGMSTCLIPGYAQLIANGGGSDIQTNAIASGGDINIPGQMSQGLDQNGAGGFGGGSLLGFGGAQFAGGGKPGIGYGSGGGSGKIAGDPGGAGAPGVMVVRYF